MVVNRLRAKGLRPHLVSCGSLQGHEVQHGMPKAKPEDYDGGRWVTNQDSSRSAGRMGLAARQRGRGGGDFWRCDLRI